MLPQTPITEDERPTYLEANEGMPDGHYAKFGGEDLPGLPGGLAEAQIPDQLTGSAAGAVTPPPGRPAPSTTRTRHRHASHRHQHVGLDVAPDRREPRPISLHHVADLGFDAVELPLEKRGDLTPAGTRALARTGLTPYVVGAMAPGRDLVATDAGYRGRHPGLPAGLHRPGRRDRRRRGLRALLRGDRPGLADGRRRAGRGATTSGARTSPPSSSTPASAACVIGIEPLNRYETSLVNTVDQALDRARTAARARPRARAATPTT